MCVVVAVIKNRENYEKSIHLKTTRKNVSYRDIEMLKVVLYCV